MSFSWFVSIFLFCCFFIASNITLQEKLLSADYQNLKPEDDFLEPFSGVLGSKWASLAAALSLSEEEVEECRRDGSSKEKQAILALHKWALRDGATYGQLCRRLQAFELAMH